MPRLGNWNMALYRGRRPPPAALPSLGAGFRREAVLKIVTNYFEDRRESPIDAIGTQMLADVIGYRVAGTAAVCLQCDPVDAV